MAFPYQRLDTFGGVLVAASLSRVDLLSLEDGSRLSSWTCLNSSNDTDLAGRGERNDELPAQQQSEPASKKVRLSNHDDAEREKGNRKGNSTGDANKPSTRQLDKAAGTYEGPAVIALTSTKNGQHMIVITAEDKTIWVLEYDMRTGRLQQLSQRAMPKRPCAVVLSSDESTIIYADKFGDVYSLPLLIPHALVNRDNLIRSPDTSSPSLPAVKPFVPAANDLTVHSTRNRKALENQLKQTQRVTEKPESHFGQKLLLGHVSMLTSVVLVEQNGQNYIVTSDKDEHIRISRGTPQAHMIESYCLGHTEFVSCLCIPTARSNILISGGGEDEIYVWDWLSGKVLQKVNLRSHIPKNILRQALGSDMVGSANTTDEYLRPPMNIAVSNISHIVKGPSMQSDHVVVTCEGIPVLFVFSLLQNSTLSHLQTLLLTGNPLDIIVDGPRSKLVVSLDTIHEPGSTSKLRTSLRFDAQRLVVFMKSGSEWTNTCPQFTTTAFQEEDCIEDSLDNYSALSSLFYSLENLRKRVGEK